MFRQVGRAICRGPRGEQEKLDGLEHASLQVDGARVAASGRHCALGWQPKADSVAVQPRKNDLWDVQIEKLLEEAKRVDMTWETTTYEGFFDLAYIAYSFYIEYGLHFKVLSRKAEFPLKLASLCSQYKIKTMKIVCQPGNFITSLEFLCYTPSVKELCLEFIKPDNWSCLKHVESLELNMRSILCEFDRLDNLQRLVMKNNKGFVGFPTMKNLREVEFDNIDSSFEAIVASLVNMPRLERLVVRDVDLLGSMPSALGSLTALKKLVLVCKYWQGGDHRRAHVQRDVFAMLPNLETLRVF